MDDQFAGYDDNKKLGSYLQDPRKLMVAFKKNKKVYLAWIFFFISVYILFAYFSSGDFSFVLTLGSLVTMFGYMLLLFQVLVSRTCAGLSKNSIICHSICLLSRLGSILLYDGYLPADSTGDLIYRVAEIISFLCCTYVLYLIQFKYKNSYNWDMDTYKWYFLVVPMLIFSMLFHPALNGRFSADVPWTFALYLESIAMFPQLDLFRKRGGDIDPFQSHYVASTGISRILQFIFWIFTYQELNEEESGPLSSFTPGLVGYYVMAAQIIQIAMLAEYLYFYIKSFRSGNPFSLPSYVI